MKQMIYSIVMAVSCMSVFLSGRVAEAAPNLQGSGISPVVVNPVTSNGVAYVSITTDVPVDDVYIAIYNTAMGRYDYGWLTSIGGTKNGTQWNAEITIPSSWPKGQSQLGVIYLNLTGVNYSLYDYSAHFTVIPSPLDPVQIKATAITSNSELNGNTPAQQSGVGFFAANSAGVSKLFAGVFGTIVDSTAGSEAGELHFVINDGGNGESYAFNPMKLDRNGALCIGPGTPAGELNINPNVGERLSIDERDYDDARVLAIRNLKADDLNSLNYRIGQAFTMFNSAGVEKELAYIRAQYKIRTAGTEVGKLFFSLLNNGVSTDVWEVGGDGSESLGGVFPADVFSPQRGRLVVNGTSGNSMIGILDDRTPVAAGNGPGGVVFIGRTTDGVGQTGRTPLARITGVKSTSISGNLQGEIRLSAASGAGLVDILRGDQSSLQPLVPLDLKANSQRLRIEVVASGQIPAAGAAMDGTILIENVQSNDRNLIIYAGGQRFRINPGVSF